MDKKELRRRVTEIYESELSHALGHDEEIDLAQCRSRAAIRIGAEMAEEDISAVWIGHVEGIARNVERGFEVDLSNGQLRMDGAIRTAALSFVPATKARALDWTKHDQLREAKFREHASKRSGEREAIREIVNRLRSHGGDPTTIEACPELFLDAEEQAA